MLFSPYFCIMQVVLLALAEAVHVPSFPCSLTDVSLQIVEIPSLLKRGS